MEDVLEDILIKVILEKRDKYITLKKEIPDKVFLSTRVFYFLTQRGRTVIGNMLIDSHSLIEDYQLILFVSKKFPLGGPIENVIQ